MMDLRFWNEPRVRGRRMILEALEERIVMDAALDIIPQDSGSIGSHADPHAQDLNLGQELLRVPGEGGASRVSIVFNPAQIHAQGASVAALDHAAAPADAVSKVFDHSLDVVLVSKSVEHGDAFPAAAAAKEARAVVFDPASENLHTLAAKLRDVSASVGKKIDHLAIVDTGSQGHLKVGTDDITSKNLDAHQQDFKELAQSLNRDARIDLYGCDIGAGTDGAALVSKVATVTGAKVWASNDTTGTVPGANWELEVKSAPDDRPDLLDPASLAPYEIHLAQVPVTDLTPVEPHIDGFKHNPDGRANLAVIGGDAFFSANNGAGPQVFQSSNIANVAGGIALAGQTQLTTFATPPLENHISGLTAMGPNVYFAAQDVDTTGIQVYQATTIPSVTQVSNFNEGMGATVARTDPHISHVTANADDNAIYFVGEEQVNLPTQVTYPSAKGIELWRSNGAAPPVDAVTDGTAGVNGGNVTQFNAINTVGAVYYDPDIREVIAAGTGGTMYFTGHSTSTIDSLGVAQGAEVWRTDGGVPTAGNITDNVSAGAEHGAISCFGAWGFDGAIIRQYNDYDPHISQLTPVPGVTDVFFVANEPHSYLGYEVWRSDGNQPVTGAFERTHNPGAPATSGWSFGNVTNFGFGTSTDPDIHDLRFVPTPIGLPMDGRIYFVADDGFTGPAIWSSDGGNAGGIPGIDLTVTDRGAAAQVTTAAILPGPDPDISQLTAYNSELFFVANRGSQAAPDYELFRVTPSATLVPDTVEAITNFPQAALVDASGNPVYGAHGDPHIKLVAAVTEAANQWIYFAADSITNQSRELFRVDANHAAVTPADPITMQQVTNFGFTDPNFKLLTDGTPAPVFVAQDATHGQEFFTIANAAPQVTIPALTTVLEDNNNLNTPISLANAVRVSDPDRQDVLTVDINAPSGFTTVGANLAVNFDTARYPGLVNVPDFNAGLDTHWAVQWIGDAGDWREQAYINDVLSTMTVLPDLNSNQNTVDQGGPIHQIDITAFDNGIPALQGAASLRDDLGVLSTLTITPVNDLPTYNTQAGDPPFPGLQTLSANGTLTFNGANANQILVRDVDVNETLPLNNVVQVTLAAPGGAVTLANTLGLAFVPGEGTGTNDTYMVFTGNLTAVNDALNGMTFRALPNLTGVPGVAPAVTISTNDLGHTPQDYLGDRYDTATIPMQFPAGFQPTDGWWNQAPVNNYGGLPIGPGNPAAPLTLSAISGTLVFDGTTGSGHANFLSVTDDAEAKAVLPRVPHDADVRTTLSVTNGALQLAGAVPATVTAVPDAHFASSVLTLTGPPSDLGPALQNLRYISINPEFVGVDPLIIVTDDLGHNPPDLVGPKTDTDAIAINVLAPGGDRWGRWPRR